MTQNASTPVIRQQDKNTSYDFVKTIFFAALIALSIRSVAYEPFSIPSGSMIPTMLVGDYLFVSKSSYGYSRYSFPMAMFPIEGRINGKTPERGDVVVFRKPHNENIDYIKRVIGMPGDKIQVMNGRLYINDQRVKREFIGDYKSYSQPENTVVTFKRYKETLPNKRVHEIIEKSDREQLDNTSVFTVPTGNYFMMGDNRDGSLDSRVLDEVGYVPFENFVGRAERIFFSVDEKAKIWQIWNYPWSLRLTRFFQKII